MTARQKSLGKTRHHSFSGSGDQGYPENAIEETRQIGNKRAMGSQRDRRISTRKGLFITIHAKLRGETWLVQDGINRMSDLPVLPGD
ncbi:hypothetical protein ASPBRDRAFT_54666 [Aspergillus brasiliensis CBS 101740]|uniref:Uncharacterized protein n=1 Tax=Aspergillus brasiliensis (strain CBS 101740 / IMI 381727 / IBT 21946) TaxID=767769 RepID=A0A1L9UMD4_ASPBC|nr:hypothetical protein ASPBRDRAFT_54666 [Aspergillus brasiliensis CBS 101740]